ncbi:MAG: hypothetical protein J6N52_01890 [Clostridia bacterium]|nr:hypothetical protein [Clostridia bacterium]
MMEQAMNITTNLRAIEAIKGEVLQEVAKLYGRLADFEDTNLYENVSSSIATIIAMDYILARRMGLTFESIDDKIVELTSIAEENDHELEQAFGDMSELRTFVSGRVHR